MQVVVERASWVGSLAGRWTGPERVLRLRGVGDWSSDGGSSPFQGLTRDGEFWVKPLNNTQTPRVTINEFVIGRLGRLIGAPVCEVEVVEIGADLAGQPYCAARQLETGLACGSRDVPNVNPKRSLEHRREDDNRRRHAGILAFYDWCWGSDDQWLYEAVCQNRVHSHDHGHFLPCGPDWTIAALEASVDQSHQLGGDIAGLDVPTLEGCEERLQTMTADEIRGILGSVPTGWPIDQDELEALGWFLERRAGAVAGRLWQTANSVEEGYEG